MRTHSEGDARGHARAANHVVYFGTQQIHARRETRAHAVWSQFARGKTREHTLFKSRVQRCRKAIHP